MYDHTTGDLFVILNSVYETVSSSTGYCKQKTEWNLGLRRSFPCRLRIYNSKYAVTFQLLLHSVKSFLLTRLSYFPHEEVLNGKSASKFRFNKIIIICTSYYLSSENY